MCGKRVGWASVDGSHRPAHPSRNFRGETMGISTFPRATRKCAVFPVTSASTPPATATSRNASSSGSGSLTGRGAPITRSANSISHRKSAARAGSIRKMGSREHIPVLSLVRPSTTRAMSPPIQRPRICAGGPNSVSNPETTTFVSSTTCIRNHGHRDARVRVAPRE